MVKQLSAISSDQLIDIGDDANDGTGDTLREAFTKVNSNFTTLFGVAGLTDGFKFVNLSDVPVNFVPNAVVCVTSSSDGLIYNTLRTTDLKIEFSEGNIDINFGDSIEKDLSFSSNVEFNKDIVINSQGTGEFYVTNTDVNFGGKELNLGTDYTTAADAHNTGIYIPAVNGKIVYKSDSDSFTINKNFLPDSVGIHNLGSASKPWSNIYVHDTVATRVTSDNVKTISTESEEANITGNLLINNVVLSTDGSVTAGGSDINGAILLTKIVNVIDNALPGTGVQLPAGTAGQLIFVINSNGTGETLKVYPSVGCQIIGFGIDQSGTLTNDSCVQLIAVNSTMWQIISGTLT